MIENNTKYGIIVGRIIIDKTEYLLIREICDFIDIAGYDVIIIPKSEYSNGVYINNEYCDKYNLEGVPMIQIVYLNQLKTSKEWYDFFDEVTSFYVEKYTLLKNKFDPYKPKHEKSLYEYICNLIYAIRIHKKKEKEEKEEKEKRRKKEKEEIKLRERKLRELELIISNLENLIQEKIAKEKEAKEKEVINMSRGRQIIEEVLNNKSEIKDINYSNSKHEKEREI